MKKQAKIANVKSVQQKIHEAEENFKSACLSSGQPLSYCALFLNYISKQQPPSEEQQLELKTKLIAEEISLLQKKESFSQQMTNFISQRQEIIRHLRSELILNRNSKQPNIKASCKKLDQIRLLTLVIVQNLHKLSKKIKIQNSQYSTEIMKKLIQGTDFLKLTSLRKHIEFSNHDDPLFLIPLRKFKNLELTTDYNKKSIIDLFTVSQQFQIRLQNADMFLKCSLDKSQTYRKKETNIQSEASLNNVMFPTIQKRSRQPSSFASSKEPEYTHFSSMIKRIIQDSALRRQIKRRDNIFNPKKRSRTETDDYQERQQSNTKKSYYQLDMPLNAPKSLPKRVQPLPENLDTSSHIKSSNKNKVAPFLLDEGEEEVIKPIKLKSKTRFKQSEVQEQSVESKSNRKSQRSKINQQEFKQLLILNEPKVTIKNKRSKMRNRMIRDMHETSKQTVYNSQEETKEEIHREEPTDSNWSKFYRTQSKGQFSPKVRQKINSVQVLSKLQQSTKKQFNNSLYNVTQENQELQSGRNEVANMSQQTLSRYKNPFDQLYQIREQNPNEMLASKLHRLTMGPKQKIEQAQNEESKSNEGDLDQSNIENRSKPALQNQIQLNSHSLSVKSHPNNFQELDGKFYPNRSEVDPNQLDQQVTNKANNIKMILARQKMKASVNNNEKMPMQQKKEQIKINESSKALALKQKQVSGQKQQIMYASNSLQRSQYKTNTAFYVDYKGKQSSSKYQSPLQKMPQDGEILSKAYANTTPYSTVKRYQPIEQQQNNLNKEIDNKIIGEKSNSIAPPIQQVLNPSYAKEQNIQLPNNLKNSPSSQPAEEPAIILLSNTPYTKFSTSKNKSPANYLKEDKSSATYIKDIPTVGSKKESQNIRSQLQQPKTIPQKLIIQPIMPPKKKVNVITQQLNFQQINIPSNQNQGYSPQKPSFLQKSSKKSFEPEQKKAKDSPLKQSQNPASILQRCVFQSKSMQQSQMLSLLKSINRNSFRSLQPYLTTNYFRNRHILLTKCYYNQQMACYCLYYPYLVQQVRLIFILHFEIKEQFSEIQSSLINTFIKYIFCNDPANKIIFLKHRQLFLQQFTECFREQGNFVGEVKTPIKGGQLAQRSYLFQRKQLKCNKQEQYTSVFNSFFLFAASPKDISVTHPKQKDVYLSSSFLKKLQNTLKKRQAKLYRNYNQLSNYLQEQKLPQFQTYGQTGEVAFYSQFLEDCLVNVRYFVYSKYFYFTIDPPFTFLYQNQDIFYLFISTSIQKKYFVLADKIFQETQHIDFHKDFRENIVNKNFNDIFRSSKRKGAVVGCPQFKKEVQFSLGNSASGILSVGLNWKEYIKGIRYFAQQKIQIQIVGPFFCALVEVDEVSTITHLYSTLIGQEDIIK